MTALAEQLRTDIPDSQRSFAIMMGAEFYQSWGNLLYSVRTGKEAYHKTFGRSFFEYMTEHPDRHAIYDAAMTGVHGGETDPMLDAYLMRHVLHDWQDEQAATILRNCRQAMNPQGRVLAIETVIPPLNEPCFGKWLDLMMLIVNRRERTEDQYRLLFSQAGLRLNRVVPTAHEISVIEGVGS